MRFSGRLVVGTVLILLVTVIVLVWSSEVSLRHDLENDFAAGLEREARLVREALPPDSAGWDPIIRRFAGQNEHRISLIGRNGQVIADSDVPPDQLGTLENHAGRPEVRAALGGVTGRAQRGSASVGRDLMYIAIPGGPGVVRLAADLGQVNQTVRRAQSGVLLAALLALVVGTALAVFGGRAIARPLTEISDAARTIAAGTTPRFPRSGIPEIDALVQALRQMDAQLLERFEALRREQAGTAAMVESMAEGVLAVDPKGRVVSANGAARRLLGYQPAAKLPDLQQIFRSKPSREMVEAALTGETVLGREIEVDGQILMTSVRPLVTGGAVMVLRDLTEIRRLEEVRRDFVANVSHELKTPLTSISGYTETLLSDRPDQETTERFLQVIQGNSRRMQRLVDDLLDLSRIESGHWQPRIEEVNLSQVIGEVVAASQARSEEEKIQLVTDFGPGSSRLMADEDAVRQVVSNLVDNALRYTPEGGRIVCRTRLEGEEIAISVADTGIGITRQHLPRIFERFYRADPSRSRDAGGTGLGLAIVKHMVEAHDGRVSVESEWGKGTTVTCVFPRGVLLRDSVTSL
jgi:two-component system, OmpR family, phosphate regulon sensor histidine kinase PhoR